MAEKALLIHVARLASEWKMPETAIRRLIADGKLASEIIGNRLYVPVASAEAYQQRIADLVAEVTA